MTKQTRSKSKTTRQTLPANPKSLLTALIVIGIFAIVYAFSGADPLGLFASSPHQTQPALLATSLPTSSAGQTATQVAGSSAATSGSGDWWKIYFTDPGRINDPGDLKGSVAEKLINYINAAMQSIHFASFEFNLTPLAEALIAAQQRGVEVRFITDDVYGLEADSEEGRGQIAMLKRAGIEIRNDQRSAFMHHKFWIFDGRIVWTGSTNATVNDHFRNNNNVIIIESPELAAIYERQFADMWQGEFGAKSASDLAAQQIKVARTQVQVIFSPEDRALDQLVPLIESAQQSIRFMAFSFTHDGLTQAMLARAKAGVDVQGIFETRGSETEFSALRPLFCARVPVRQDGNPATFHHKVIVIDGKILITGSLNFSDNADRSNNENTLVLSSASMAKLYLQEFDRRWAEASEPTSAAMSCP